MCQRAALGFGEVCQGHAAVWSLVAMAWRHIQPMWFGRDRWVWATNGLISADEGYSSPTNLVKMLA